MAMTPSRPGAVNKDATATNAAQRALFLQVFSGEVLAAFAQTTSLLDKHTIRTITNGKSASFPVTGRTTAAYHTPGAEIVGTAIGHNEKIISIDAMLLADAFIANIDEAMNHFDVRSIYSKEMGEALAKAFDKNVIQEGILGSRASTLVTGLPNGAPIVDTDLDHATLATRVAAWAKALYTAAKQMDVDDVPGERFCALPPGAYSDFAQNMAQVNKDWGGQGSYADGTCVKVAGITLVKSNNIPSTDLSAAAYHGGDFQTTQGLVWTPSAIGTVKLMDLAMESEYLIKYQGTLMVAKYAMGHGWLRPNGLIELKTA